jgi:hypothetical protein
MEDAAKDDPHQPIKSHYWDIKWRELRPWILAAPFITFALGLLVAWVLLRQLPSSQDVSLQSSASQTSPAAEKLYDHTYEDSCTVTKATIVHIPVNTAVLLPPDCLLIGIGSVDGYIAVVGEEGNKILAIVPPKHMAEFTRARGFFDWNNEDAHASIKMLPRH